MLRPRGALSFAALAIAFAMSALARTPATRDGAHERLADPVATIAATPNGSEAFFAWRTLAASGTLTADEVRVVVPAAAHWDVVGGQTIVRALGRCDAAGAKELLGELALGVHSAEETELRRTAAMLCAATRSGEERDELVRLAAKWAADPDVPQTNRVRCRAVLWCVGERSDALRGEILADLKSRGELTVPGIGDAPAFQSLYTMLLADGASELDEEMVDEIGGVLARELAGGEREFNDEQECLLLAALSGCGDRARKWVQTIEVRAAESHFVATRLLYYTVLTRMCGDAPSRVSACRRMDREARRMTEGLQLFEMMILCEFWPLVADAEVQCELLRSMESAGDDDKLFTESLMLLQMAKYNDHVVGRLIAVAPSLPERRRVEVAQALSRIATHDHLAPMRNSLATEPSIDVAKDLRRAIEEVRTLGAAAEQ